MNSRFNAGETRRCEAEPVHIGRVLQKKEKLTMVTVDM